MSKHTSNTIVVQQIHGNVGFTPLSNEQKLIKPTFKHLYAKNELF